MNEKYLGGKYDVDETGYYVDIPEGRFRPIDVENGHVYYVDPFRNTSGWREQMQRGLEEERIQKVREELAGIQFKDPKRGRPPKNHEGNTQSI